MTRMMSSSQIMGYGTGTGSSSSRRQLRMSRSYWGFGRHEDKDVVM